MKKKWELNRRSFLRGAGGAALALPFLECMLPGMARAQAAGANLPIFGVIYFPDGVNDERWLAKSVGKMTTTNTTGTTMEEFAKRGLLGDFSTLAGSYVYADGIVGAHPQCTNRFLTGYYPPVVSRATDRPGGKGLLVNRESLDQWIARMNGGKTWTTAIRCEAGKDSWAPGFNMHMSWKKDPREGTYNYTSQQDYDRPIEKVTRPTHLYADKIMEPRDMFEEIFKNYDQNSTGTLTPKMSLRKTIIDTVYGERGSLLNMLGAQDKIRLESWFDEVHEHQKGLQGTSNVYGLACPSNIGSGENTKPGTFVEGRSYSARVGRIASQDNFSEHARAWFKTIKLGIMCGQVNNFTLMMQSSGNPSNHRALFEGERKSLGVPTQSHHYYSHDFYTKTIFKDSDLFMHYIDRLHAKLAAEFLQDLKETSLGENSILHDSLILYGSAMGNAGKHHPNCFPTMIAGNAKGQINMSNARNVDLTVESGMGTKKFNGSRINPDFRPFSGSRAYRAPNGLVKYGNILRAIGEIATGKNAAGMFNDNAQVDLKKLIA